MTLLRPYGSEAYKKSLEKRKQQSALAYNKSAKDLKVLEEGETVRMKPFALNERAWKKAVVTKRLDERSYELLTSDGNMLRRNRVDLKPSKEKPPSFQITQPMSQPVAAEQSNVQESHPDSLHPTPIITSPEPLDNVIQNLPTKITTRSGRVVNQPARYQGYWMK